MPDQPKSLPIRGDRRGNGRTPAQTTKGSVSGKNQGAEEARPDAPRSTPRVDPQRMQSRRAVDDRHQNSAIAANPIFPREGAPQSYQIAPGQEQQNSRVSASGALMFNSTLDLTLRAFANIPRGDYGNVAAYIRANPSILRANPQDLLREAIHAYQYASRGSDVQYSGKMMYGDSCIQQYLILKRLQHLIQKLVERRQTRGPTEGLDDLIKSYFNQLLDKTSSSRKQLYEEFNEACTNAKRPIQSTNPNPHPNAPRAQPAQPGAHARPPPSQGQRHSVSGRPPPESPLVDPNESASGLDSRYIVRPSSYYQPGRVFAILWHEPFNDSQGNTCLSDNVSTGLYGERIYSSIRRMVVVRQDHGCSVCIQINTYGKRGLGKFKTSQRDIDAHSIIHMDDTTPHQLPGEPISDKRPIAVRKASPDQQLSPWSRLCYSQPHTVQHTVKALDVGWVVKESLPYLLSYFQMVNALP
ncbi:uncharacterized protein Z519_10862 [Cladophialophora bantiana CBS 173.52]|uniref:Uncharacterized protein n=1 Tax=Cladophialophora bantiana (strain ATCC 10958 / CBS 173.52 / CDC B-1940 / NIH 8579) TaxID=1442370 RepID=A0A0D2HBI5_CLAB1|nr:uncharacterized protein Z519_10862 [Cladophialophora bantiana CBS 173.52]KIW88295.1 hypothetical protein Z519_10862 [Cladophialophora bantiana CBS 173.52]